jgi:hypothetical protein
MALPFAADAFEAGKGMNGTIHNTIEGKMQ